MNAKLQKIIQDMDITICSDEFVIIESNNDVDTIEQKMMMSIDDIFKDWGFSDEYSQCDNCQNHIHTHPYDMIDFSIFESDIICGNCIRDIHNDYADEYIKQLINNPKKANTILKPEYLKSIGFNTCRCKDDECAFSNGLHIGDNDNPNIILKNAITKNPDRDYIFDITDISQFTVNFTLYSRVRKEDNE